MSKKLLFLILQSSLFNFCLQFPGKIWKFNLCHTQSHVSEEVSYKTMSLKCGQFIYHCTDMKVCLLQIKDEFGRNGW